jgi:hypothetical protein
MDKAIKRVVESAGESDIEKMWKLETRYFLECGEVSSRQMTDEEKKRYGLS